MAKMSFLQRFPHAGIIMVLAVVFAIPLTLWSFNNASTQTQEHAQTVSYTCTGNGGTCYKYSCPSGNALIAGTCGAMADSACCISKLSAPTGLQSKQWYCKYGTPLTEHDTANFWWSPVKNATSYILYYRIYSNIYNYAYKSVSVGNTTQKLIDNIYTNLNGRHIQWYVRANNSPLTSISPTTTTPTAFVSCPQ